METKLWYDVPAASFCEALPIGNGSLGAMVYGCIPIDAISLNLDTLWSGTGRRVERYVDMNALTEAKRLCMSGKYLEAQSIVEEKLLGVFNESYMPLGSLKYEYKDIKSFDCYKRELDLERAVASTEFSSAGRRYKSEIFASNPDGAIVLRFLCDTSSKLNVEFCLESKLAHISTTNCNNEIIMTGNAPTHVEPNYVVSKDPVVYEDGALGMPFCCVVSVSAIDGNVVRYKNGRIRVENASEITAIITAKDGYCAKSISINQSVEKCIKEASTLIQKLREKSFYELLDTHLKDHSLLFQRSKLNLYEKAPDVPTNRRLRSFRKGEKDLGLYCLYYHFNRYLLIASSRKGSQPANLQGIWNESVRPVWSSNWTTNINTEMNYWPAGICNLIECYEPLLAMLEQVSVAGKETAKKYFGCSGWAANHNVDIWRHTEPVAGIAKYAFWPMGGIWLTLQVFEYYKFTRDKELLLERIYPIMRGAVLFCLDWLVMGEDGCYHTPLSTSPENTFYDENENECAVSYSSTMDIALIKELFKDMVEASDVLGVCDNLIQEISYINRLLPAYQIGRNGQLQEWFRDFEEYDPAHRHFSGLVGFHPGTTINQYDTPELVEGVRKFIARRLACGGGHIGWSCAWLINLFARLGQGDEAKLCLDELLKESSYDNLFDLHPPLGENEGEREVFQIDGNLGAASGIASMFLRSCYGIIEILPALPAEWRKGEIIGLRAEGGIIVDIKWSNIKKVQVRLQAEREQEIVVRYKNMEWNVRLSKGQSKQLCTV